MALLARLLDSNLLTPKPFFEKPDIAYQAASERRETKIIFLDDRSSIRNVIFVSLLSDAACATPVAFVFVMVNLMHHDSE